MGRNSGDWILTSSSTPGWGHPPKPATGKEIPKKPREHCRGKPTGMQGNPTALVGKKPGKNRKIPFSLENSLFLGKFPFPSIPSLFLLSSPCLKSPSPVALGFGVQDLFGVVQELF